MHLCPKKAVITFKTTTMAMKAQKYCRENHINGRIIPVPLAISTGCGMCWYCDHKEKDLITNVFMENGIEIEGVHEVEI